MVCTSIQSTSIQSESTRTSIQSTSIKHFQELCHFSGMCSMAGSSAGQAGTSLMTVTSVSSRGQCASSVRPRIGTCAPAFGTITSPHSCSYSYSFGPRVGLATRLVTFSYVFVLPHSFDGAFAATDMGTFVFVAPSYRSIFSFLPRDLPTVMSTPKLPHPHPYPSDTKVLPSLHTAILSTPP